ncbi:MAG: hypothetical protein ACYCWE_03180 [Eubacteriales bacterium]
MNNRIDLNNFGYTFDVHSQSNPPEARFLRGEAAERVCWGIAFEEPREIGEVIFKLHSDMGNFDNLLQLEYFAPKISWYNAKDYNWYTGHWEAFPDYAEKIDERTFVFKAKQIKTSKLRLRSYECNFQLPLNSVPVFDVNIYGTAEYIDLNITFETGLWGHSKLSEDKFSVYNGVINETEHPAQGKSILSLSVTDKRLPEKVRINPDRTVVTLETDRGNVSFLPMDLKKHPYIAIPDFGVLIYKDGDDLPANIYSDPYNGQGTIRERIRKMPQRTFEMTEQDIGLKPVLHIKGVTDSFKHYDSSVKIELPDKRMQAHWDIGLSHLLAFCSEMPDGRWDVRIGPYKMFGMESSPIIKMIDFYDMTHVTKGALDVFLDSYSVRTPEGLFGSKEGCMCIDYGIAPGDSWIPYDSGYILLALAEHYFVTRDKTWLSDVADKILGCINWIFREIDAHKADSTWGSGLMPPSILGDISEWMVTYWGEAVYFMGINNALNALSDCGEKYKNITEAYYKRLAEYREDIRTAYRKNLGLTPVIPLKNGTFAPALASCPYLRGFLSDLWPLSPNNGLRNAWLDIDLVLKIVEAGVFDPSEIEVKWILDCMEDRLALDDFLLPKKWDTISQDFKTRGRDVTSQNTDYNAEKDWYAWGGTGWQNGYNPLAQCYLITGEAEAFLRTFYNIYAVEADPDTFWFREHAASIGYPIKTFEEAMFLYRLRSILVYERDNILYLNRCVPEKWYEEGFSVSRMPTFFGLLDMKVSVTAGKLSVRISLARTADPKKIILRLPKRKEILLDTYKTEWEISAELKK